MSGNTSTNFTNCRLHSSITKPGNIFLARNVRPFALSSTLAFLFSPCFPIIRYSIYSKGTRDTETGEKFYDYSTLYTIFLDIDKSLQTYKKGKENFFSRNRFSWYIYIKFAGNDRWKENFRTPGRPISVGMERALNKERSETSPRLPRSRGTKLSHCVLIRFTAACVAARRLDFCGVQKYASRCCNAAESRNTALYHPLDHFNL